MQPIVILAQEVAQACLVLPQEELQECGLELKERPWVEQLEQLGQLGQLDHQTMRKGGPGSMRS